MPTTLCASQIKMTKIKQHFIDAKNLVQRVWGYKLILIILALLIANIYQTFPVNITLPSTVMAYEKETVKEEINTQALLDKYYKEELEKAENEIRIRATRRLFDELGAEAVKLNPYLTGE